MMRDPEDFIGAAVPIGDLDIPRVGAMIGVGEDEIHAFLDVEAAGAGFDAEGRPKMLFEPHVLYRNLDGADRDEAVRRGLAYPDWRPGNYPADSYPRLCEALTIDREAAFRSASWGLGQILGENHAVCGYDTAEAMVRAFMDDEAAQLQAIIDFLIANHLDDDLRAHRWAAVARGYNGPGYARHGYHTRLEVAYQRWARIRDTAYHPDGVDVAYPVLRRGTAGMFVRDLQELLARAGYPLGKIDAAFGPATEAAVLAAQADLRLGLTGTATQETWLALQEPGRRSRLAEDRQNETVADLRQRGSKTIRDADVMQVGGGVVAAAGGLGSLGGLLDQAEGMADQGQRAVGVASQVGDLIAPVADLLRDYWPLALLAVGALIVWRSGIIKRVRLADHKSGAHRGR